MNIRIDVKCPYDAPKHVKTLKKSILGFKVPVEQHIVDDKNFYWILEAENDKELQKYSTRAAKAEFGIKQFYKTLFKLMNRANTLMARWNKGVKWVRKYLKRQLSKYQGNANDMKERLDSMSDDELKKFFDPHDREDMEKFLGIGQFEDRTDPVELISVAVIDE